MQDCSPTIQDHRGPFRTPRVIARFADATAARPARRRRCCERKSTEINTRAYKCAIRDCYIESLMSGIRWISVTHYGDPLERNWGKCRARCRKRNNLIKSNGGAGEEGTRATKMLIPTSFPFLPRARARVCVMPGLLHPRTIFRTAEQPLSRVSDISSDVRPNLRILIRVLSHRPWKKFQPVSLSSPHHLPFHSSPSRGSQRYFSCIYVAAFTCYFTRDINRELNDEVNVNANDNYRGQYAKP